MFFCDPNVDIVVNILNQLDCLVENGDANSTGGIFEPILDIQTRVWDNLKIRESMVRHKSRFKWLKYGGHNSKFFHSFMKSRFQKNNIAGLLS